MRMVFAPLLCVCLLPALAEQNVAPSQAPYESPTLEERWKWYVRDTYGPGALFRTGFVAAMDQSDNDPPEWGQGMAGYGRRAASRYGRFALQETLELGGGMLLGEDPRYHPCRCTGFFRRSGHALLSTVVTRNREGNPTFAFARVGAVYGGSMLATHLWYPSRYTAAGDGFRLGNISLGVSGGVNLIREFWPDIKRVFGRD